MDCSPLELNEIASLIDVNKLRRLGLHLGIDFPEIQRFEKANNQNPSQCAGTEDMLVAYSRNGGTRELLCRALREVEHGRLACRIEAGEFWIQPVAVPPTSNHCMYPGPYHGPPLPGGFWILPVVIVLPTPAVPHHEPRPDNPIPLNQPRPVVPSPPVEPEEKPEKEPAEMGTVLGFNIIAFLSNKNKDERMQAREEGRSVLF